LIDPTSGADISGIDDAVITTAREEVFYLSDTGNNRVLKIEIDDVPVGSLFCSISSLNYLGLIDIHTGVAKPFVSNLNAPHGIDLARRDDDDDDRR
jgi:hypothetical protein